jgi:hypothetical protein
MVGYMLDDCYDPSGTPLLGPTASTFGKGRLARRRLHDIR